MNSLEDRLSKISALRPPVQRRAAFSPADEGCTNFDKLVRLLDGTVRKNALGSHLLVRRMTDVPPVGTIDLRALDLLLPGQSETARDPENWLFLDTETTGLSGGTGTYAFLVGIGWWENGRFIVEQYFMRDHGGESSMLAGLLDRMRRRPVLVTYNGKSFDWPLLETRFRMTRIEREWDPSDHLDLLYPARRLWSLSLKSVALTQVETHVLSFRRGRDIPSETIPRLYFNFLQGSPPEEIEQVFHHNHMDICGLALLAVRILDILSDPSAAGCGAAELFGVSRLLGQRGDADRAERFYRMAVEKGLPESAERIALKELALLAKRRCDFRLSNGHWEKLLGDTAEGMKAYEQLAIYYEHHAGDFPRAARLTREALVRLQQAYRSGRMQPNRYMRLHADFRHRLDRLSSKNKSSAEPTPSN